MNKDFTKDESKIIGIALGTYKAEVKKLMIKAEKLGLKEAENLKRTFIMVDVLGAKVAEE